MNKKIKRGAGLIPAFIVLMIVGGREANGWGKTWMGMDLERQVNEIRLKFGELRFKPSLVLEHVGYDSNLYRRPTDPVADLTMTIGPGIHLYLPLQKTIVFSIYESPQYVYFKDTEDERSWNNYFEGKAFFVFNRVLFSLGMGRNNIRDRVWNSEVDLRQSRLERSLEGSALWQMSKRTSFILQYRKYYQIYEDLQFQGASLKDALDREEDYLTFTAHYKLSYRTNLLIDFEYGNYDFKNVSSLRDSRSYGVYGALKFSPFGKVRGELRLGYRHFDSLDPERSDFRGIVGSSQLTIPLSNFLNLKLFYNRNLMFSVWLDRIYFLENMYGSGLSFYASRNIRLDYDFRNGRHSYPPASLNEADRLEQERQDLYQMHKAGIYFRLKGNLGLGVAAYIWSRNLNIDTSATRSNFFGFSLINDF